MSKGDEPIGPAAQCASIPGWPLEELFQHIERCRVATEQWQRELTEHLKKVFEHLTGDIAANVELQKGKASKSFEVLARHGWFPPVNSCAAEANDLAALYGEGKGLEADRLLARLFSSDLDEIEADLVSRFPRRAVILAQAFEAHRSGSYCLSVPVFLSQADGICQELTESELFRKHSERIKLVGRLARDHFYEPLLRPLEVTLPLSESTDRRASNVKGLRRHAVLHGTDVDYGTELNSFKALSLLHYVAFVLQPFEQADE